MLLQVQHASQGVTATLAAFIMFAVHQCKLVKRVGTGGSQSRSWFMLPIRHFACGWLPCTALPATGLDLLLIRHVNSVANVISDYLSPSRLLADIIVVPTSNIAPACHAELATQNSFWQPPVTGKIGAANSIQFAQESFHEIQLINAFDLIINTLIATQQL